MVGENKIEFKDCIVCSGEGTVSNCCEKVILEGNICSSCYEHCDVQSCLSCDGEGEIPKDFDDWTDDQEAMFNKADDNFKFKQENL